MKTRDTLKHIVRYDRFIREHVHDPYKTRLKLTEPTVCPQCGAVFHKGRWHWADRPENANEELCQACHRTNDGHPAGEVTLKGAFVLRHKPEITGLVHNLEEEEKSEHPLHCIMDVAESGDETIACFCGCGRIPAARKELRAAVCLPGDDLGVWRR